ncbi:MAG: choice-of-anchor J domain-containing protein, partial [Chitinophagaceae bacterium]
TFSNRWGDYSDMSTDITNDSLFWFTGMYGASNWKTKISSFKLEALPAVDAKLYAIVTPEPGYAQCASAVTPTVTLRNSGTETLTSLTLYTQLNNGPKSDPISWTGALPLGNLQTLTLPAIEAMKGVNSLKIFITQPNGKTDENKINDTLSTAFTILSPLPGPLGEGFETTPFPIPGGWRVVNKNPGSLTWTRTTAAKKSGAAAAVIEFYNYNIQQQEDYLLSPLLECKEADSILFSFERAYRPYNSNPAYADALAVVVSSDCGATFQEVWRKEGLELASIIETSTSPFIPQANEWTPLEIDLKPYLENTTNALVGLKAVNRFGNNLYVDDLKLRTVRLPYRDAQVKKLIQPDQLTCNKTIYPSITLANQGKDTLKNVQVIYSAGGLSADTLFWTGNLPKGKSEEISFKNYNLPITFPKAGRYTLMLITRLPNGLTDENTLNDTLISNLTVFEPKQAPIQQGFELPFFPTEDWAVKSSGSNLSWERTTQSAVEKTASLVVRNFRYKEPDSRQELYGPVLQLEQPDSVILEFNVAHATRVFPGSTEIPMDTLEVVLTSDCGNTFQPVYKKWGQDLTTLDKNIPPTYSINDTTGFFPRSASQWRKERIDLTTLIKQNQQLQVVFRNTSNHGNNTYLDNISLYTVTLPKRLKQEGYLIAPNPFEGSFSIRHWLPPTDLRGIQVSNALGKVVYSQSFSGNAPNNIPLRLNGSANGVYQVKLIYTNRVVLQRMLKIK